MANTKVVFSDMADDSKAVAERYIIAMYDKTLLEFARYLQQSMQENFAEGGKAPLPACEAEQEET